MKGEKENDEIQKEIKFHEHWKHNNRIIRPIQRLQTPIEKWTE